MTSEPRRCIEIVQRRTQPGWTHWQSCGRPARWLVTTRRYPKGAPMCRRHARGYEGDVSAAPATVEPLP